MLKQVASNVWVHQSELLQNNSTVSKGNEGVLLVDPGLTEAEMVDIAAGVAQLGEVVEAGFSTHPDWDHALWHESFGDKPRYATEVGANFMREFVAQPDWREKAAAGLPEEIAHEVPLDLFGKLTALPKGSASLPWDKAVRVIEHEAHAKGHAALFIEDSGVLVAGDMLSDVFVPMLRLEADDPIGDYLHALKLFEEIIEKVHVVIPGHGSVATGEEVRARIERDKRYVTALRDGAEFDDPRIGPNLPKGWEWVNDIHEWQVSQIGEKA